jgi:membrane protease YdiL (CAAX protease family)
VRALGRLLDRLFLQTWRELDAEAEAERAAERAARGDRFDARPIVVLIAVAVGITLQEYVGDRGVFQKHFAALAKGEYGELLGFAWWTCWRVFGYVVLPVAAIAALPGERLRDYYVSPRGFVGKLWIYLGLFGIVLPAVIVASQTAAFARTYPFYRLANRSTFDLLAWEVLYAIQFVSLEFFFRGFMLKALKPRFGSGAIFVMIVPYCMIHFGKPMPETLGAIIAGVVLGTLAMRTRSIWGGAAIHIAVAITMDLLALGNCPSGGRCPGR